MKEQPYRITAAVLLLAAVSVFMAGGGCVAPEPADGATRVILVRHAEKAGGGGDPSLTEQGRKRAELLADMLAGEDVGAIFSTQWLRTRSTAKPLSQRTGVPVTILSTDSGPAGHAKELAGRIAGGDFAGKLIVCVEHSNTIAPILTALGVTGFSGMAEYGQLFSVRIPVEGSPSLEIKPYGPDK